METPSRLRLTCPRPTPLSPVLCGSLPEAPPPESGPPRLVLRKGSPLELDSEPEREPEQSPGFPRRVEEAAGEMPASA